MHIKKTNRSRGSIRRKRVSKKKTTPISVESGQILKSAYSLPLYFSIDRTSVYYRPIVQRHSNFDNIF